MSRAENPRPTAYPPVLWPEDVATLLGFPSERAALEWLRHERIPVLQIGGRTRILYAVLMRHLERKSDALEEDGAKLRRVAGRLRARKDASASRAAGKLKGA